MPATKRKIVNATDLPVPADVTEEASVADNVSARPQRSSRRRVKPSLSDDEDTSATINAVGLADEAVKVFDEASWTFKFLLSVRLCGALYSVIGDCDETYNFWEPTHYLTYGSGFQTWEYAPEFALRSYAYLLPLAVVVRSMSNLFIPKVIVFYGTRVAMALACSYLEHGFVRAAIRAYNLNIGLMLYVCLCFSAGMWHAAVEYLPSTFAMYCVIAAYTAWLERRDDIMSIVAIAVGALLGWPFAALAGVGIAVDFLVVQRAFYRFPMTCLKCVIGILSPIICVDRLFYGYWLIAPMRIVLYNIFSEHGPSLYGTEPWYYYVLNLFLNCNIVFVLAVLSLPILLVCGDKRLLNSMYESVDSEKVNIRDDINVQTALMPMLSMYVWLGVFFTQPHKEERFMYPIYPLIALCCSVAFDRLQKMCSVLMLRRQARKKELSADERRMPYNQMTEKTQVLFCAVLLVLFVSRSLAVYFNHSGHMSVYTTFAHHFDPSQYPTSDGNFTLCVGREWHHYPSSFLLPSSQKGDVHFTARFVRSGFRGQLPARYVDFGGVNSTRELKPGVFNGANRENSDRYVRNEEEECHFMVDLRDASTDLTNEPHYYTKSRVWLSEYSSEVLLPDAPVKLPFGLTDNALMNMFQEKIVLRVARAFYIPFLYSRCNTFTNVVILRNIKLLPYLVKSRS